MVQPGIPGGHNVVASLLVEQDRNPHHTLLCDSTTHRTPFPSVELGLIGQGRRRKLTAKTDGYLATATQPQTILALVEAKADIRSRQKRPGVLWQEATEKTGTRVHGSARISRRT